MKRLINIQNEDNECFRLCLLRYLNPVNKNPAKVINVDKEFAKQLNFKDMKFLAHEKDYVKIEKQNNISINAFGNEDETPHPIYTSKQTFEKHADLLLLTNSKNSRDVLIKDFNRFMTYEIKHHGKKTFADIVYSAFLAQKVFKYYVKKCLVINHTKVLLLEEGEYVNFHNFKRLAKALFVSYGDFECVLIPSTYNIYFLRNTKKYQYHIGCSYGYRLIYVDDRYSKPYKTYFGKNAIDKFLNNIIKESEYCSKTVEIEFNETIVMTKNAHEDFESSTNCWICKK